MRDDELVKRAHFLRNSSPAQFQDFVVALKNYADEAALAAINAPPEQTFVMQGFARATRVILRVFEEATKPATPRA